MSDTSEGPGQVLRAEREALGVTTRDVAETLNLAVSMVEAIEADDYEQMPASVFARGYIRAYARLLSLEPEPLVARYPEDTGVAEGNGANRISAVELLRHNARLLAGAGGLALLLLLIFLAVWLWPESEPVAEPGPDSEVEVSTALTEAAEDAEAAAATVAEVGVQSRPVEEPTQAPLRRPPPAASQATLDADESSPEANPEVDPQIEVPGTTPTTVQTENTSTRLDTAGQLDTTDQVVAAAEPAVDSRADPPGVRRITEFGGDRLSFDFSDDCWVDVKSATGRRLYGDLNVAGTRLSLVGEGPFRILLGYAPGVRLSFNGEPISLAPHTRNNVATLVVGQ